MAIHTIEEDVDGEWRITVPRWIELAETVNTLAGMVGGGSLVMRDGHWYDNGYLFGCREIGQMALIPNTAYAYPILIGKAGRISALAAKVNTTQAGSSASLGIWTARVDGAPDVLLDQATIVTTSTGWQDTGANIDVVIANPGLYWVGITCNHGTPTFETWQFENMGPLGKHTLTDDNIGHIAMSGISGVTLVNWSATVPSDEWSGNAGTNLVRIMYQWQDA